MTRSTRALVIASLLSIDLAFEIIPGTVTPREPEELNDFETGPIYPSHE